MAGETTLSVLDGFFKDQFHKDIENTLPDHVLLQKGLVDYWPAEKTNGEFYSVPTILKSNQGVSYLGESGAAATLEDAIAGEVKEAQVKGSEMVLRGRLTYKVLSQAAKAGAQAFKKSSAHLVEDLQRVASTRVEIAALYGQSGLGAILTYTNVSGSTYDVVLSEASFAPGIWVGSEGAKLEVTDDSADGALVGDRVLTISTVTISSRTLRVTQGGSSGTPAAADVLHFKGATTGSAAFKEMIGLCKQISAQTGTMFNINKASYGLYRGNTNTSFGALTKAKVIDLAMKVVDNGNMGDLVVLISTRGWSKLAAEDMALRSFDGSYSKEKSESGSKELSYEYVGGNIKVICHPMVKAGDLFMFSPDNLMWIGSSKPTFEVPGSSGEKFFRIVENTNAVEIQNYSDLAIYAFKPAQCAFGSGITYS